MEIGIETFAAASIADGDNVGGAADSINRLLERIELADEVGLDVFGIGEHHRQEKF